LTDPALRRAMDSEDICQSVLADFFIRAANGQFDLDSPEQLIKLLATMARNKVLRKVEHEHAARRDAGRRIPVAADSLDVPANACTPSQIVMRQELADEARQRLTDEERLLAEQRALGRNWMDIAAELGITPDSARMKLARGLDRVSKELGLEDSIDE
jgi:RNA polymerase sigma-70 factor (ECF subfamily)